MEIRPIYRQHVFSSIGIKANHQLLHKPTNVFITPQSDDVPKKYIEKKSFAASSQVN